MRKARALVEPANFRLPRLLIDGVLFASHGAVAQLEERLHGMQEVVGSIPIGSTISNLATLPKSLFLRHLPCNWS
jgi:hypothetical protein